MSNHQITDVQVFLEGCDQSTLSFNPRQAALYTGLQCEELAEKLEAIGLKQAAAELSALGDLFKKGNYDHLIRDQTTQGRIDMLDADLDLTWVSIGAAYGLGMDVKMGWDLLAANNMTKIDPITRKAKRDANGKIVKPAGFSPPNFGGCVLT